MNRLLSHTINSTTLAGLLAIGFAGYAPDSDAQDRDANAGLQAAAADVATMTVGPQFIDFSPHVSAERAILRISGPQRYALTIRTDEPSAVTVDLLLDAEPANDLEENPHAQAYWDQLPEGQYSYELNLYTADGQRHVKSGHFEVNNGSAKELNKPTMGEEHSSTYEPNWLEQLAGATLDFLVPSAHADTASNFIDVLDDAQDNDTDVTLHNDSAQNIALCNVNGSLQLGTSTGVGCDTVIFALNSLGKVGIHTTSPQEIFHVVDPNNNTANIRIENTQSSYNLATGETTGFRIRQISPNNRTVFQIQPSAPSNSLIVNNSGNVGLGTSSPATKLDVTGAGTFSGNVSANGFNSTGSFFPLTMDTGSETAALNLGGVGLWFRDTDGHSVMKMNHAAPSNSLVMEANGVGIGTATPSQKLHVAGNAFVDGSTGIGTSTPARQLHIRGDNAVVRLDRSTDATTFMMVRTDESGTPLKTFSVGTRASGSNNGEFVIQDFGTAVSGASDRRMTIDNDGDVYFGLDTFNPQATVHAGSFVTSSSARIKENIETIPNAAEILRQLRGVNYNLKSNGKNTFGLIAEEIQEVLPEIVSADPNSGNAKGVEYTALIPILIEAYKEQQVEIERLKSKLYN